MLQGYKKKKCKHEKRVKSSLNASPILHTESRSPLLQAVLERQRAPPSPEICPPSKIRKKTYPPAERRLHTCAEVLRRTREEARRPRARRCRELRSRWCPR